MRPVDYFAHYFSLKYKVIYNINIGSGIYCTNIYILVCNIFKRADK